MTVSTSGNWTRGEHGAEPTPRTVWAVSGGISALLGIAAILMLRDGWALIGDEAVVVVRSSDVFGSGSPLLGMPSAIAGWTGGDLQVAHPGPLAFWVLAPFTSTLGSSEAAALVGTWLLCSASILSIGWAANRRLGRSGALGALGLVTVFLAVCGGLLLPLNPLMAVLSLLAMYFFAWGVIDGDASMWPGLILTASFAIQADLAYGPSVVVTAAGCAVAGMCRWRRQSNAGLDALGRRNLWTAAVVGALVWAPPLVEAVAHGGGNLVQLVRSATASIPVEGAGASFEALGRMVSPTGFFGGVERGGRWIGLVLLVPAVLGLRLRRRPRRSLAAVAVAAVVGAMLSQYSTPSAGATNQLYVMPVRVASVVLWFALVVLSLDWAGPAAGRAVRGWRVSQRTTAALIIMGVLVLGTPLAARTASAQSFDQRYLKSVTPSIANVAGAIETKIEPGSYRIVPLGNDSIALTYTFIAETRRRPDQSEERQL